MGVQIVCKENHIREQSKPLPCECLFFFFNLAEFRRWNTWLVKRTTYVHMANHFHKGFIISHVVAFVLYLFPLFLTLHFQNSNDIFALQKKTNFFHIAKWRAHFSLTANTEKMYHRGVSNGFYVNSGVKQTYSKVQTFLVIYS